MFKSTPSYFKMAVVYGFILFLDRMDLTIVNVALPTIANVYGISIATTDLVSTTLLVGLSISIGASIWLAERFGYKKIFQYSVIGFAISATSCAFAHDFKIFILCRFIQGVFGGIIIPVGSALLYTKAPKSAYNMISSIVFLPTFAAPAVAPYIGGLLMSSFSYKAIFVMNLPICLIVWILGEIFIEDIVVDKIHSFDKVGLVFTSFIYILFFASLSFISHSQLVIALLLMIATAIVGLVFYNFETSIAQPLIDFKYFKRYFLRKTLLIQLFFQMSHFGSFFILGLYLQLGLGFAPQDMGLVLSMQAIGAIIIMFPAKSIVDKYGMRVPMMVGLFGYTLITPLLLFIHSPDQLVLACAIMLVRGLIGGWLGSPMQTMSMLDEENTRVDVSRIGGLFNIARQLSISLGVAVSGVVIGVVDHIYHYSDSAKDVLGYAMALKMFSSGILLISIFALAGALIASTIDNEKLKYNLSHKN